jgi:hypothetical protein
MVVFIKNNTEPKIEQEGDENAPPSPLGVMGEGGWSLI